MLIDLCKNTYDTLNFRRNINHKCLHLRTLNPPAYGIHMHASTYVHETKYNGQIFAESGATNDYDPFTPFVLHDM